MFSLFPKTFLPPDVATIPNHIAIETPEADVSQEIQMEEFGQILGDDEVGPASEENTICSLPSLLRNFSVGPASEENTICSLPSLLKKFTVGTASEENTICSLPSLLRKFTETSSSSLDLCGSGASGGSDDTDSSGENMLFNLVLIENMILESENNPPVRRVLDKPTLAAVAKYMKTNRCQNIIVMVGAGISTSVGIPNFRSPGTSIYSTLAKYNLPLPQCIFEIDYFHQDPATFYKFAKELFPKVLKPTPCHFFLRLLNQKGKLLRLYTQNIDGLERVAGIPPEKLVEAHGTLSSAHCMNKSCNQKYDFEWLNDQVQCREDPPVCGKCGTIVKPDVIFFGETLSYRFHSLVAKDFPKCDLLIAIGSSLTVAPFSKLVNLVPPSCPRIVINNKRCGEFRRGGLFHERGGFNFESDTNRDVLWISSCDEGCFELAEALGYTDELCCLIDEELVKLAQ